MEQPRQGEGLGVGLLQAYQLGRAKHNAAVAVDRATEWSERVTQMIADTSDRLAPTRRTRRGKQ